MANENELNIIDEYISSGSDKAATQIIRTHQKFVFAVALRFLNSYEDAEDITQEVFIKALQNLKKFNRKSSLKTWLYRITVNSCINYKRKKSIFSVFSRSHDADLDNIKGSAYSPEQSYLGAELETRFLAELAKLPEKQRETFALRYFENMTYEEISAMIGTSVGGLKANYFQAVKKLAEKLNKDL